MCCVEDTVVPHCEDTMNVQCVDVRDYHLAYKDDFFEHDKHSIALFKALL